MVFSSVTFLFYFLPVFSAFYFVSRGVLRDLVMLAGSLLFYAWGEPVFVLMTIASIAINHMLAQLIEKHESLVLLWLGLACNILFIGVFKYLDLAIESVNWIARSELPLANIALPLGISFFTFQAMAYLVDVYRKMHAASGSLLRTALYISMFPQLVAGPIVRYSEIEQDLETRKISVENVWLGIRQFMIGFCQKVLIANTLAEPVDQIYDLGPAHLTMSLAWIAMVGYTLQIYFDFQGYSNMAIGLGRMFGFTFPQNFNYPYIATSITDFWRRWHMTLSRWFRDYLYIPLGGNRLSPIRTYLNLSIVFLVTGLWHGAAWTFVAWGAWHGAFLIFERAGWSAILSRAPQILATSYTLLVVILGWVLFRAETFASAELMYKAAFGLNSFGNPLVLPYQQVLTFKVVLAAIFGIYFATPFWKVTRALSSPALSNPLLFACFLLSIVSVIVGSYNPFIYFRF